MKCTLLALSLLTFGCAKFSQTSQPHMLEGHCLERIECPDGVWRLVGPIKKTTPNDFTITATGAIHNKGDRQTFIVACIVKAFIVANKETLTNGIASLFNGSWFEQLIDGPQSCILLKNSNFPPKMIVTGYNLPKLDLTRNVLLSIADLQNCSSEVTFAFATC